MLENSESLQEQRQITSKDGQYLNLNSIRSLKKPSPDLFKVFSSHTLNLITSTQSIPELKITMNNFHFNPTNNRSVHLMKEYEQATRQIQDKKRQLERKTLEIEFYQDPEYVKNKHQPEPQSFPNPSLNPPQTNKKYQNLADQIMNDLLFQNKSNKINSKPEPINYPYDQPSSKSPPNQMYQNLNNFNQNDNLFQRYDQNQPNYLQNNQLNQPNPPNQKEPPFMPRQNNFIQQNKRQLEKQKLQNPSSNDLNPFIPRSQPIKRSVQPKDQKPIINERQQQKLKLQQGQSENPFWGDNRNKSRQRNPNNQVNYQQYENVRERQIQKLQKQNDFDLYQRPTSPPAQIPAEKDIQAQNISKKVAFENRYSNPFVKDEDYLRQQKEEQQRKYRMELEEQKKIEEERKKNEKQKVKQEKYAFNAYEPGAIRNDSKQTYGNNQSMKSPALSLTKKVDPNGKPPAYDYKEQQKKNISSSDIEFMRMKANELKDSFKRGRILHDEYITQVKKLAQFYKVDYREVIDRKVLGQEEVQLPWIKDKKQEEFRQDERRNPSSLPEKTEIRSENPSQKYQIVENQQSLERFPDSQTSLKHQDYPRQPSSPSKNAFSQPFTSNLPQQPYYGQFIPNMIPNPNPNFYTQNLSINPMQYGLASTSWMQQMPTGDVDLMRKIFEEVKAMKNNFQKNIEKQKTQKMILQQTFVKFMAQNMIQNPFQIPNQNPSAQLHQQHLHNFSPKPNKKQNSISDGLQLNLSEQSEEYIQKSLSGIVNKIPFHSNSANRSNSSHNDPSFLANTPQGNFNKKQQSNKNIQILQNQETIDQFFSKPYKQKKFKKFSIMVDVSQSSMEIPSVSNFLALKNGKDVVNKLFEQDLMTMKKLQRDRDLEKLRNRVDNQLSYGQPSSVQSSSTQQQTNAINQKVSYGNPPNFTNYAETFNKNSEQFIDYNFNTQTKNSNKNREKEIFTTQSKYEEYENYSRSRQKESRSGHQQNHRSYKKEKDDLPADGFLKRHVSNQEQNLPDFADQSDIKVRSPVYYSPKLNSQILEQDEYQTAQKSLNQQSLESEFYGDSALGKAVSPKAKQSTNKKYQMKKKDFAYEEVRESEKKAQSRSPRKQGSQQRKSLPKATSQQKPGIMSMLKQNNQVLSKYVVSPKNLNDYSPEQVDIRDYSSINSNPPRDEELKNYFSQNSQSNQTNAFRLPPLVANANSMANVSDGQNIAHLSDKFNSQKNVSNNQYHKEQSLEQIQSEHQDTAYNPSNQYQNSRNQAKDFQHSQQETIKSYKYSVVSSRKPPSVNISQTVESIEQSSSRMFRPPLNKKKSSSRKKQSSIARTKFQKDSILQKPPPSQSQMNSMLNDDPDIVVDNQPLKFDSNVYDSEYEQSVSQKDLQKRIEKLQAEQRMKISEPQITVNPPVIASQKSNLYNNESSRVSGIGGGKLKSLQEARNLAKQCKKKSINTSQNDQMFKYEQKMSELESFLTKRDDSVIRETKQVKSIKLAIQKSPQPKKNIMNLLDDLQNESSYKEDFESYREESQYAK